VLLGEVLSRKPLLEVRKIESFVCFSGSLPDFHGALW
jgi:hypothetical protein